ncbi:MAG: TIM barrel protein [Bacillota bacterium]|nr:TIM barrel protein [Bacillota bacterium]
MGEIMSKYMKVGIVHFMAYPSTGGGEGPIVETIQKIAEDDYFDAIEISWIKDINKRKEVKKILEISKLKITYVAHPRLLSTGLNINDCRNNDREKALKTLKDGIDEAYELGAESFAYLSGKYKEKNLDEAFEALLKSTKELCSYAGEKGSMNVLLEIFDHKIDKKSLIGPTDLALKLAEEVEKEFNNFGLIVDLSHIPLIGEAIRESIIPIKKYIKQFHIGNSVVKDPSLEGYGDNHPRFGFPNSENDEDEVVEFLKVLKEIGYLNSTEQKVVSFEVKPWKNEKPELVISNAKRTLNRAWSRI